MQQQSSSECCGGEGHGGEGRGGAGVRFCSMLMVL